MIFDVQATMDCGFTLKRVRDMIRTHSQMHHADKYLQHSSTIWPVWLNGWLFTYELSGSGFESRCKHLLFIAIGNAVLRDSEAILIKAGWILSGAIVFLGFDFWRLRLTLSLFTDKKIALSLAFSFAVVVFLIFKILR